MDCKTKFKFVLLVLIISLLSQDIVISSNPISTDTILQLEMQENVQKENSMKRSNSRDDICGNRGRFCEIICKNNPSEGGKMCK